MRPRRARVIRELERLARANELMTLRRDHDDMALGANARAFAYRYAIRLLQGEQPFMRVVDEADE